MLGAVNPLLKYVADADEVRWKGGLACCMRYEGLLGNNQPKSATVFLRAFLPPLCYRGC